MKEIKIVGTFCTGVVLVILSMYYMSRNSTISDQVFLDNIEALSGGENGGGRLLNAIVRPIGFLLMFAQLMLMVDIVAEIHVLITM